MKKLLFSLFGALAVAGVVFAADVIPNESAFPAAKPLINSKFAAQDVSNLTYNAANTAQAVSNSTYALKSTITSYVTNDFGGVSNILWIVSGVITNVTTVP